MPISVNFIWGGGNSELITICGYLLFVSSVCAFFVCVSCVFFLFFLSFMCSFLAAMSFAGYFLARCLLSAFPDFLRTCSRVDLVWFRLSCDHGWGS